METHGTHKCVRIAWCLNKSNEVREKKNCLIIFTFGILSKLKPLRMFSICQRRCAVNHFCDRFSSLFLLAAKNRWGNEVRLCGTSVELFIFLYLPVDHFRININIWIIFHKFSQQPTKAQKSLHISLRHSMYSSVNQKKNGQTSGEM